MTRAARWWTEADGRSRRPADQPLARAPRTYAVISSVVYVLVAAVLVALASGPHALGRHAWPARALAVVLALLTVSLLLRTGRPGAAPLRHHATTALKIFGLTLAVRLAGPGDVATALTVLYASVPLKAYTTYRTPIATFHTVAAGGLVAALVAGGSVSWEVGVVVEALLLAEAVVLGWLQGSPEVLESDPLTGLGDRRGLERGLEQSFPRDLDAEVGPALVLLDVDGLRALNLRLGRDGADDLLLRMVSGWSVRLPRGAAAFSLRSGEFAVLLGNRTVESAVRTAQSLRQAAPPGVAISAGAACWEPGDTPSALLSRADASLRRAKDAGRDRLDPQLFLHSAVDDLRRGLRAGELDVVFVPVVDTATGTTVGAKALPRWHHPSRGLVDRAEFQATAEDGGVSRELGLFVLRAACLAVVEAEERGRFLGRVQVTVTPGQLRDPQFLGSVGECLGETSLAPHRLVLGIGESAMILADSPAVRTLRSLRQAGVRVALDGFGTGQSSLGRLADLPVDVITIDAAFVRGLEPDGANPVLVAITALAQAFGLSTIAAGVEDAGQVRELAALGCHLAHGPLYGTPGRLSRLELPATGDPAEPDVTVAVPA